MESAAPILNMFGSVPIEFREHTIQVQQFSPLAPESMNLEACPPDSLNNFTMLAPSGTIERQYNLALALQSLTANASLKVMAPKDRGGARLKSELVSFGCDVVEDARRHFRICDTRRPSQLSGVEKAIASGAVQKLEMLDVWSQPGVFSWDRFDPGSQLLLDHLPEMSGQGADFGCGIGFLSRHIFASPQVQSIALIDIDRRAVTCAKLNIEDSRASFIWGDVRSSEAVPMQLDFVVMNPPFHDTGVEDRSLGQDFIEKAHRSLKSGGACWLTANRHLPYEGILAQRFKTVKLKAEAGGYKIYEAVK